MSLGYVPSIVSVLVDKWLSLAAAAAAADMVHFHRACLPPVGRYKMVGRSRNACARPSSSNLHSF